MKKKDLKSHSDKKENPELPISLEKVLGITTNSNVILATCATTHSIFYATASAVVHFNCSKREQVGFFIANQQVSSLCISKDGQYLAAGEKGDNPKILVWEVKTNKQLIELSGHKYGVGCIEFSPDALYLVSVGFKQDRQIMLWDWRCAKQYSTHRIGNKVNAINFHGSGDFFVTSGDKHLKWWNVLEIIEGESVSLEGKPASILEEQQYSNFVDVICTKKFVYTTTSSGMLCMFNNNTRIVDKWVQVESPSSYCIEVLDFSTENLPITIAVGCSSGVIRLFAANTFKYVGILPFPTTFGDTSQDSTTAKPLPACYALKRIEINNSTAMVAIYANHSLFIWDVSDLNNIRCLYSSIYHHSCVWDIQFIEPISNAAVEKGNEFGKESFFTCSADNTIRMWSLSNTKSSAAQKVNPQDNLFCIDMMLPTDKNNNATQISDSVTSLASTATSASLFQTQAISPPSLFPSVLEQLSTGLPDKEFTSSSCTISSGRTLAIHPNGNQLICGDRSGRLRVFDLKNKKEMQYSPILAHSAEILTLHFSPQMVSTDQGMNWVADDSYSNDDQSTVSVKRMSICLLASAGRDRLIHILNANDNYSIVLTLDHHSSSVTSVKFTTDGKRLISCGGDKTIVFYTVNGPHIKCLKIVRVPGSGCAYSVAVEATNKFCVSSGQDKKINVWNLQTGKHMRAYQNELMNSELYKTEMDPSGTFIVTSSFDKRISILDFFSGELIAQVGGHSEVITGLRFSPNGNHLVSVGGDGCIFIWKVAKMMVKTMQDRLLELFSNAKRLNSQVIMRQSIACVEKTDSSTSSIPNQNISPNKQNNVNKNAWVSRINPSEGYEIFGRKVVPFAENQNEKNKNKYTLELTESVLLPTGPSSAVATNLTASDVPPQPPTYTSQMTNNTASPNRLANLLEAKDMVNLSTVSDVDEKEYLDEKFDNVEDLNDLVYNQDEFEPETKESAEGDLDKHALDDANTKVDQLEKTAHDLESWLEKMLKSETMLDDEVSKSLNLKDDYDRAQPHAVDPSTQNNIKEKEKNPFFLGNSLSSAFFKGLHSHPDQKKIEDPTYEVSQPHEGKQEDISSELRHPEQRKKSLINISLEVKRKETEAAIAKMKDKLLLMGVLEEEIPIDVIEEDVQSEVMEQMRSEYKELVQLDSRFLEPNQEDLIINQDDSINVMGMDVVNHQKMMVVHSNTPATVSSSLARNGNDRYLIKQLRDKTSEYRQVIDEFEKMKRKVVESYQALTQLRQSVDQSMVSSHPGHDHEAVAVEEEEVDDLMNQSLQESDELLNQFQKSLQISNLSNAIHSKVKQSKDVMEIQEGPPSDENISNKSRKMLSMSGTNMSSSGVNNWEESVELSSMLEKYSDRLLEMVTNKIMSQPNKK